MSDWTSDFFERGMKGILEAPPSVWWLITEECNLKCRYCFASAGIKNGNELSFKKITDIVDDFAESGVGFVTYIGGEPLLRRDIFNIIDYSSDCGLYTGICSNGLLLTEESIDRMIRVGCESLGISIDSLNPVIHDRLRGVKGALQRSIKALSLACEKNIRTSMRVVVTSENLPELCKIFYWAVDHEINEMILLPEFPVGRGSLIEKDIKSRDLNAKKIFARGLELIRKEGRKIGIDVPTTYVYAHVGIEINKHSRKEFHEASAIGFEKCSGCVVGKFAISVQADGTVFPCPFLQIPIGNLTEESIENIWQESPLLNKVRNLKLQGFCKHCHFRVECGGGCRARAYIHEGSIEAPDSTCFYKMAAEKRGDEDGL